MRECFQCGATLLTGGMREVKVDGFARIFCPIPRSVIAPDCVNNFLKAQQQSHHFKKAA